MTKKLKKPKNREKFIHVDRIEKLRAKEKDKKKEEEKEDPNATKATEQAKDNIKTAEISSKKETPPDS